MKTTKSISKLNVNTINKTSMKSIVGGTLITHIGQRPSPIAVETADL